MDFIASSESSKSKAGYHHSMKCNGDMEICRGRRVGDLHHIEKASMKWQEITSYEWKKALLQENATEDE